MCRVFNCRTAYRSRIANNPVTNNTHCNRPIVERSPSCGREPLIQAEATELNVGVLLLVQRDMST